MAAALASSARWLRVIYTFRSVAAKAPSVPGGGEGSVRQIRGADTVIAASSLSKGLQRIMARPEIKSYQELKGRRIGITQYGSAAHLVLLLMLKKWNMRTDQVQILQVGSSPAMLASLDKGGIDAAVLTLAYFLRR